MSLFFDADKIMDNPEIAAAHAYETARIRKGRILFYSLLTVVGIASFTGYYLFEQKRIDDEFAVRREALLGNFEKELAGMRHDLTPDDSSNYPYVEPSKPHEFTVKHLSGKSSPTEYVFSRDEQQTSREQRERSIESDAEKINAALRGESGQNGTSADAKRRVVKKDLKAVFDEAVNSTNTGDLNFSIPDTSPYSSVNDSATRDATDISMLTSNLRNAIPPFVYSSHNYSTDASKRSITLNGSVIKEGGTYKNLEILKIAENHVIMRVNGKSFSIRAMEDYRQ
ncbi:general secretion pathway protein GspB [Ruminobacter sp. RM87]|jgi:hypothetical protein|uniref:general secretion pathway protein GspB n=1 Tax=Ruminobacter sp. RM87 TaxID=1200567 RepID=UPI0004E21FDA|nr:general secretion pathway protein GspB [Ruminobacter sp. RM87]